MYKHKAMPKYIVLIALIFLNGCINPLTTLAPAPTATSTLILEPTPTFLVNIPGITEPADVFPCQGGTWTGLRFGITTEEQLVQWLSTSPFVYSSSLEDGWRELPESLKTHTYHWNINESGQFYDTMKLNVVSETLYSLWTPLYYPLILEKVISDLGEPEFIDVATSRYEECAYSYAFYYPLQGIKVDGVIYDEEVCKAIEDNLGPLEAHWQVDYLTCGESGTLQELIKTIYGVSSEVATQIAGQLQPWTGFGQVELSTP